MFSFHPCPHLSPTSLQPLPPPLAFPLSGCPMLQHPGHLQGGRGLFGQFITPVNLLASKLLRHLCFIMYHFAHLFSATHTGPPNE